MPKSTKSKSMSDKEVKAYVRKQLKRNIELKYADTTGYVSTASNTGWVIPYPSQGAAGYQRIGDKIMLKGISVLGDVYALVSTAITYRMIVCFNDSSSVLSGGTLFRGGAGNYIQSEVDTGYVTVIRDMKFQMNPGDGSSETIDFHKKFNKAIHFLEGTGVPKESYIHVWIGACDVLGVVTNSVARIVFNIALEFQDA